MHFIQVKTYSSIHVNVEHKNCMRQITISGQKLDSARDVCMFFSSTILEI